MRRPRAWLVVALVSVAPVGVVSATTFDYQGFAYETGGLPLGSPGDTLTIPVVGTTLGPDLGFDPENEEVTALLSGLVSQGSEDAGEGVFVFRYGTGRLDIYRDASRDHDFGVSPPNATSPSSFTNGTLCLGGEVTDFVLYWDPETGGGAYEGNVRFDTGNCLASLSIGSAEGYTFGGVFSAEAVGEGAIPEGYALQVDGFLEAQKKPVADCPLDCFGIEDAQLDFPRHGHRNHQRIGSKDGKFKIEGQFLLCDVDSTLDPEAVEVTVRIGDYTQVFGDGDLRPCHDDDDDDVTWNPVPDAAGIGGASAYAGLFDTEPAADPGRHDDDCDDHGDDIARDGDALDHDRTGCWKYKNSRGERTITKLVIERERSGEWNYEICGRGIARGTLLPDGTLLEVEITIGSTSGVDEVTLTQKKKKLRFHTDDICEPECEDEDDGGIAPQVPAGGQSGDAVNGIVLLDAVPNPFNATTQVMLRQASPGTVQLRIFDIRGRLVRVLHDGELTAGTHRFTWHGDDEQGRAVSSGVYVYRLDAPGGVSQSRKLVVAK